MAQAARLPIVAQAVIPAALAWIAAVAPGGATDGDGLPGSIGIGAACCPIMGNGGYDARHRDLERDADVHDGSIDAAATIAALAVVDQCALNLDLEGPAIAGISAHGASAEDQTEILGSTPGAARQMPVAAARGRDSA